MTDVQAVLRGEQRWACVAADALSFLKGLPDGSADLVFFSPPYEDKRRYGELEFKLIGQAWVDWLRPIIVESARVSSGLVVVNATGKSHKSSYSPVIEWLTADLTRHDGLVCGPSPYAWVRAGIMGSGGPRYHRRNWEPLYAYCLPDRLPLRWSNNKAFGTPPKFKEGGEPSHRTASGVRVKYREGMKGRYGPYKNPEVTNPGNVIRTANGGGNLGHPMASENEAPMNLGVAQRFVQWYVPPNGIVIDPFAGSATTGHAAIESGRRFIGADLRQSQVELCGRRMSTVCRVINFEEVCGGEVQGG